MTLATELLRAMDGIQVRISEIRESVLVLVVRWFGILEVGFGFVEILHSLSSIVR